MLTCRARRTPSRWSATRSGSGRTRPCSCWTRRRSTWSGPFRSVDRPTTCSRRPARRGVIVVEGDRLELLRPDGTPAGEPSGRGGRQHRRRRDRNVDSSFAHRWAPTRPSSHSTRHWPRRPLRSASTPTRRVVACSRRRPAMSLIVDDRRDEVRCLPGGASPAASIPATDLVVVLGELPDGRLLFAAPSGATVRKITC